MKNTHSCHQSIAYRGFMVLVFCLLYGLVCFHRSTPIALGREIAKTLNISETELGSFSSMYFWPYGISQPIVGMISDLFPPNLVICISVIISSFGSIGMSTFKTKTLLYISRAAIGLGCGPIIVPSSKISAKWFSDKGFFYSQGAILISGALGGMLAQGPLTTLAKMVPWQTIFVGIAIFSLILSLVTIFFISNNPPEYNDNLLSTDSFISDVPKPSLWSQQLINYGIVLKNPRFWAIVGWSFCIPSSYFNFTSLWGRLFLERCYGFEHTKASYFVMFLGVAYIVGIPILSYFSETFKTRKKVLVSTTIIAFIFSIVFYFYGQHFNKTGAIIALFIFGLVSSSSISTVTTMIKEMYGPSIVGTALGCSNFFPMIATTFIQNLVSFLLRFDPGKDPSAPTWEGFKIAIWLPFIVMSLIGLVGSMFSLETYTGEK